MITGRRVYFCACGNASCRICEAEFELYHLQDIERGKRIASSLGLPEGMWSPYKLCSGCRIRRCKTYLEFKYHLSEESTNA